MDGDIEAFMIHALRHFVFRTWVTILIAWPLSLLTLPALQPYMTLDWIILPVIAIWVLVFMVIGWILNRLGINTIEHRIKEATSLERMGVIRRTEKVFHEAMAVLDSVILSPLAKKKISTLLAARLARFYLARVDKDHASEQFIFSYLQSHPDDEEVAENWLRQIEAHDEIKKEHYELLSRIGNTQPDKLAVQHLLARFYLAANRTDFRALQTYRRVLNADISAATDIIQQLAVLFIQEGRADDWAMQVYLLAFKHGGDPSQLLKGIAACTYWIPETERNKHSLSTARKLLVNFGEETLEQMRTGFNPPRLEPITEKIPRKRKKGIPIGKLFYRAATLLFQVMTSVLSILIKQTTAIILFIRHSKRSRPIIRWSMITLLAIGVVILVINTTRYLVKPEKPVTEEKDLTEVIITDPFTIQVAAYLRPEDAQIYLKHLKERGLDAYITKRQGTKKIYYQVRISHFKDKESARAYGTSLKAQGIIDDFFVANYERP